MEALHLPDNVKVHFAGCEVQNQYIAAVALGVRYGLYTCFPFVERKVFGNGKAPIMALRWMDDPAKQIPENVNKQLRHTIQDSGLFTLMFGARKGKKDEQLINKWYDGMVEFTLEHGQDVTCVEIDCQKILGVDKAWEFRQRIRHDLPNNRIINVFHYEDGKDGLDRLIEFSDYIAISVPELRILKKKEMVPQLAKYIKSKKPDIDIHLLGCTELNLLKECRFCTSADSTTWTIPKRFGFIKGRHIKNINSEKIREMVGDAIYDEILSYNKKDYNTNSLLLEIERCKAEYEKYAGNQDYYKR